MATHTTNYNLSKPEASDAFSAFRQSYNDNMDIIDANLGGGGGSGNVDDVLVNGVSVVDANHDAQITSYKEVTQAQYDALPSSKLTDGIAYFIKDAGGGGGSSSHTYSTTEQEVGTWYDGKTIYERTYEFSTALLVEYNSWTNTSIDSSNIQTMIDARAFHSDGTSYGTIMADPTRSSHTLLGLQTTRNNSQANVKVLVIQYTKITD